jgi:hypothetical protein
MWPCIVICDRASWYVTVHRDMWPCIVICDRASWYVTVHRDMWSCIVICDRESWQILLIKPTRCTNFSNVILEMKLYMFRTVPLSINRSFSLYTQQWYTSYRFVDSFWAGSSWSCCSRVMYRPVWHIPLLCVQWKTPVDGQGNCPKHVEFHFQNKIWEISASSWFYYKVVYVSFDWKT